MDKAARNSSDNTAGTPKERKSNRSNRNHQNTKTSGGKSVKIVFLGGVGEIGKNMTAFEYGDDIIVVDCGMSFPTEDTPGIDVVVPDVSYLAQNKSKIRGIFITHGHEDHVGGIPYLWSELGFPPVYGTAFTLAIARHKIEENNLDVGGLKEVKAGDTISAGCFKVEFIKVCHSIAQASAFSITTPVGVIFMTGDFKVDFTPIDGKLTDLERIGEIGKKGVLLMMCESTNVERPGHTMSERTVGESFDVIFGKNRKRRLIIATFSTNNYRIQQLLDCSLKYNRKVVLSGRSMKNIVEMASKIGELRYPADLIIDIDKANKYPPERITILCTGSQGEPMSALSRMSQGDFNKVTVGEMDTVVISATPIPGNERGVYSVINNLYRLGAEVIYDPHDDIHVSGHACREELKLMMSLVRPKFFIPVHGEYRHLKINSRLAENMGIPQTNIFIPEIGNTVNVYRNKITKGNNVTAGNNFIDGVALGDAAEGILRDRKALSDSGFIVTLLTIRLKEGEIISGPDVILRGLHLGDNFPDQAKEVVMKALSSVDFTKLEDIYDVKTIIRKALRKYIDKTYGQTPMILPIIIEA